MVKFNKGSMYILHVFKQVKGESYMYTRATHELIQSILIESFN